VCLSDSLVGKNENRVSDGCLGTAFWSFGLCETLLWIKYPSGALLSSILVIKCCYEAVG
jgi:hypothetical protein